MRQHVKSRERSKTDRQAQERFAQLSEREREVLGLIDKAKKFKAGIRAKVEHPFRVIKRQFGYVKARYRGLTKNTAQLVTLFALSNLWMMRANLMAAQEWMRPKTGQMPCGGRKKPRWAVKMKEFPEISPFENQRLAT